MTRVSSESAAVKIYDYTETEEETVLSTHIGHGASSGIVTGRCRVISHPVDALDLSDEDILVYKTASPDLIGLITRVKALVTEQGGPLAILCAYAREKGIPAAVGVNGILAALKDGDMVRVDGTKGTVEVLQ